MQEHFYSTAPLELDKILELLAEGAYSEQAKEKARALQPMPEIGDVRQALEETDAAYRLSMQYGAPSFYGLRLLAGELRRAQAGGTLSMAELLQVAALLGIVRAASQYRAQAQDTSTCLDERFDMLCPNKYLEDKINGAIVSEEEMADSASPELAAIRRKIRQASGRAREALEKMIRSSSTQKYLQEAIITIRDGRFVVPVKSEHRNEIPGMVHDTSASGSTLFVEPTAAVEANNELRVLEGKEKQEMERILRELSKEVASFAESILDSNHLLIELDFLFAKARLAVKMNAAVPRLNADGVVELNAARHPLIAADRVVPIDVRVGREFDTLVITGPNTGGKTVALKTTGLLTLMAMCGLMVPAREDSEVSVFANLLADIGDEQSIEQSLSTFSAHMKKTIEILQAADAHSLVLFDELGSGTDPVEGAALATAILENLREKGSRVIATTHYAELKLFALETPGVENASSEFDVATLRPTYRLLIGVPGRSNAFAISERLGLPASIVAQAKQRVSAENSRFEEVLSNLESTRQQAEEQRRQNAALRAEAERMMREAEAEKARLEERKARELERARADAKRIVSQTRAQADAMLEELEQMKKEAEKQDRAAMLQKARSQSKAALKRLEDAADPVEQRQQSKRALPRPLHRGDTVTIVDMGKKAVVQSEPGADGMVEVLAGILKMRVHIDRLQLEEEKKKAQVGGSRRTTSVAAAKANTEIDVRGQTVDEAMMEIDRVIDSAVLMNLSQLTIIHGKGTGALRKGIHEELRHNPSVRSFRLGTFGEGEMGVTIVELK